MVDNKPDFERTVEKLIQQSSVPLSEKKHTPESLSVLMDFCLEPIGNLPPTAQNSLERLHLGHDDHSNSVILGIRLAYPIGKGRSYPTNFSDLVKDLKTVTSNEKYPEKFVISPSLAEELKGAIQKREAMDKATQTIDSEIAIQELIELAITMAETRKRLYGETQRLNAGVPLSGSVGDINEANTSIVYLSELQERLKKPPRIST